VCTRAVPKENPNPNPNPNPNSHDHCSLSKWKCTCGHTHLCNYRRMPFRKKVYLTKQEGKAVLKPSWN